MNELESRDVVVSMLLVAGRWNGMDFSDDLHMHQWLHTCVKHGHEVVLHGWTHQFEKKRVDSSRSSVIGTFFARGCQEFFSLNVDEAAERLHLGLHTLGIAGFTPSGFIAPGWLMSNEVRSELREIGLDYTNNHLFVIDLVRRQEIFAPVVCQRPESKWSGLIAKVTVAFARILMFARLPLRVAIHPKDLADPRLRGAILHIIDLAVNKGYTSLTYEQFIDHSRVTQEVVHHVRQFEGYA
jgi:hypothetical protein